jgi:hypothetical protein
MSFGLCQKRCRHVNSSKVLPVVKGLGIVAKLFRLATSACFGVPATFVYPIGSFWFGSPAALQGAVTVAVLR